MTVFWLLAAALLAVVLAVLLRALLRSAAPKSDETAASNLRILRAQLAELDAERSAGALDEAQYGVARSELERRVLEETEVGVVPTRSASGRAAAVGLALALPLLAVALYLHLGNRDALDPMLVAAADPHAANAVDMEQAVQRLAERMKAQPDSVEGWALLGRSYAQMQRFDQARDAYAQAVQRKDDDPQLLADYADALAMTQGRRLDGEPERLVLRALQIDPDHIKSLALAGTAAMARGDAAGAVKHWTRARALVPAESPLAQGLDSGLAEARRAGAAPAMPSPASAPQSGGPGLRVTVSLAPALAARVQPGDTLFVFARAAEGPRMPLAIVRRPAGQAPVTVQLDDSSAMTAQMKLSTTPKVVVVARVSRQGSATPAAGDLEGQSAPRANRGELQLLIDRVRP
jgi:cytochrome c-type biogenesis protein CcmH